jgi:predicted transcriptional regulator
MSLPSRAVLDRKEIARTFLRMANNEYQTRRSNRAYFARIAREHGLTNQDIANEYGITEAAVRAMIQRASKPVECSVCKDRPKRGHYCTDCGAMGAEVNE